MLERNIFLGTGILVDSALANVHELVRRGAAAVPALLDHLSDARPTHLRLESGEDAEPIVWRFGAGYSPRNPDQADLPPGVTKAGTSVEGADHLEVYRFAVGDLCYLTLGEIVNRYLPPALHCSGDCGYVLVNSPAHSPALAAAARAAWGGLTAEGLRQSLVADVQRASDDEDDMAYALIDLLFYSPEEGTKLTVRLLGRPLINDTLERHPNLDDILDAADTGKQDDLLANFRRRYSEQMYRVITQSLILTANYPIEDFGDDEDARRYVQRLTHARAIVARHFAGMDRHPPTADLYAFCDGQRAVVEAAANVASRDIDKAVHSLLKRTLALQPVNIGDKSKQLWLAAACLRRFLPPSRRKAIENEISDATSISGDEQSPRFRRVFFRRCDRALRKWCRELPAALLSRSAGKTPS